MSIHWLRIEVTAAREDGGPLHIRLIAAHIDTPICFGQRLNYFLELARTQNRFFSFQSLGSLRNSEVTTMCAEVITDGAVYAWPR